MGSHCRFSLQVACAGLDRARCTHLGGVCSCENRCDLKVGLLEDSQQAEHIGSSFKRSCDVAELKNIEVTAPIEALPVGLSENASDPALE